MIVMNREELEIEIEKCIREAASFFSHPSDGEVQLYARHDDEKVTSFFMSIEVDHTHWTEGENIIHLYTKQWFDPTAHWIYDDELKNELDGNAELLEAYKAGLRMEGSEMYNDTDDIEGFVTENIYKWSFFSELLPDKAEEIRTNWLKIALEEDMGVEIFSAVERIEQELSNERLEIQ